MSSQIGIVTFESEEKAGEVLKSLEKLEKECPTHWDSEKAELDQMICDIRERWSEASAASPDDFD